MRHSLYFAFALAVAASISEVRADQIVSYNMSGTITSASSQSSSPLPVAVGDHITWTLQYDASTPMTWENVGRYGAHNVAYQMLGTPVITNIVDQTTGYHIPTSPFSGAYHNWILLSNQPRNSYQSYASGLIDATYDATGNGTNSSVGFALTTFGLLPTLNLAQLQFDHLPPVAWSGQYSSFGYYYQSFQDIVNFGFRASVDPLPGTTAATPEPGSLTLFLLGAAGLAAGGIRRRLRQLI